MKKFFIVLGTAVLLLCGAFLYRAEAVSIFGIDITIAKLDAGDKEVTSETIFCRCRDGNCKGGCQLSVRPKCFVGENADCSAHSNNC